MMTASIRLYVWWLTATTALHERLDDARHDRERGDVNATTVMIVILVVGAIAAGGVITGKLLAHARKIPDP